MKTTVNFTQFCDAFSNQNRDDHFSYEGKKALFDYLKEFDEQTGTETKLDIVAICCEFSEYESIEDVKQNYNVDSIEELQDETFVIKLENESIIIQDF